ncbi:putative ribonuclease H-like domain-containing protein, partial [Tanacetum coccineum]
GQHVNTASPDVNTSSSKLNTVDLSVNTVGLNDQDRPKDMFTMGASHTLDATHVEFFSDEDEPKVNLGNITNSYTVPTTPNTRIHMDHPIENVIGNVKSSIQTRRMTKPTSEQGFLSAVWILVDLPSGKRAIGTKWVFKNKKDERGIVIRNKARLVAQGHRQEEGIDYEEVFAPVARIEEIRLFLAYASFIGFLVFQMDVRSAFLYGTIEEKVYVTQPPGFKDPDHPNKVYKMVKALYGLHQAPRAWYETLANYLLGNGFKRGKIDQTLFIKNQKGDILLVQVYVDDIIFGSTNKELCTGFEKLMNQDKYVAEILKKFNYIDVKFVSTPVDFENPLVKDGDGDDVDGPYFTQRTIPSIPIGSSICPEGFLLPVLLLVVIIVMVVIVIVILIVVVDDFHVFATGVPVGSVFLLGLLVLAMAAVCASRAAAKLAISCRMASIVMAGVSDVSPSWGGHISIKIEKCNRMTHSFRKGYGMIHEDGDNDAIGGNDDERAIRWKQ